MVSDWREPKGGLSLERSDARRYAMRHTNVYNMRRLQSYYATLDIFKYRNYKDGCFLNIQHI